MKEWLGWCCGYPWDGEGADEPPPDRIEIHCTEPPGKGYRLLSIRDRLPVAEFAFVSAGWGAIELRGDPPDVEGELVAHVGSTFPVDGFGLCEATTLPPVVGGVPRTQEARVLCGASEEFVGIETPSRRFHTEGCSVVEVPGALDDPAGDRDPRCGPGGPPDAERVGDVRAQARLADDTADSTWL